MKFQVAVLERQLGSKEDEAGFIAEQMREGWDLLSIAVLPTNYSRIEVYQRFVFTRETPTPDKQ